MAKRSTKSILSTPAYPFIEAAHYLNIPLSTLRAWCLGQGYREDGKTRRFQPIIRLVRMTGARCHFESRGGPRSGGD
jgi:hypothetical protein